VSNRSEDGTFRLARQLIELTANGLTTNRLGLQFRLNDQLPLSAGELKLACESSQSSIYAITFEELSVEQQDLPDNSKSIYTALREGELDYSLQGMS
jgi:hypothetical protein